MTSCTYTKNNYSTQKMTYFIVLLMYEFRSVKLLFNFENFPCQES